MHYDRVILLLSLYLIFHLTNALPTSQTNSKVKEDTGCGYDSCHPVKEGLINVHIVAHSHDDVGWLKTVDQYFFGANSSIQKAGVQYILDTSVTSLQRNEDRRFIYVETAFFWKWWLEQDEYHQGVVKDLVNSGRLEFISGGWCMNDEAATHYHSIIDQMTWGLRRLNDTFGECGRPKLGWQIDPFGHSREMASILAQFGFDGLLLGRIDHDDKSFRFETKTPEVVWRASANLGEKADLFTGVMYNGYSPPPGFCFDILCDDQPIIDDKKSPDYNVDHMVDDFFAYLDKAADVYATNNLIITMGMDFNYQDAESWFKNLDKLIKYSNERQENGSKYNVIYSTPSCYVKAIYDETKGKQNFTVKEDDFFPYSSDPHAYWTGYFTSRPTLKRFERDGNNFLQVCKQLSVIMNESQENLNELREVMGILQHHDAVSGTSKQHVANDYARLLDLGISLCEKTTNDALQQLISSTGNPNLPTFSSCLLANISQCAISENGDSFVVTVYNPLSRPVTKFVRLPVLGTAYSVKNSEGEELVTQITPIHPSILNVPGRQSEATVELIFMATDLPPLGFESFYVQKIEGNKVLKKTNLNSRIINGLTINNRTGLISSVTFDDVTIPLSQNFYFYRGTVGNNEEFENRSSGAYIFRPNGTDEVISDTATFEIYTGPLVTEIHQTFSEWASQVIRIYYNESFLEFNWLIGPIPEDEISGREVISKYTTNLNSSSTFYTDSNGREMLKRIRNFRPTWELNVTESIAGNYYPVTSKILIRDEESGLEFAVLNDRAQGGSSIEDGQIELMIHRNCLHDDAFGVGEALRETAFNETLVARGSHYLIGGNIAGSNGKSIAAEERDIAQRKLLDSWIFLTPTNSSYEDFRGVNKMKGYTLNNALPDNVQILTLEPWGNSQILLRLEHVLEKGEDPNLSQPVTVDLEFLYFNVTSVRETTLGGNQWLEDNERLHFDTGDNNEEVVDKLYFTMSEKEKDNRRKWNKDQTRFNNNVRRDVKNLREDIDALQITLEPMQIRTFILTVHYYNS